MFTRTFKQNRSYFPRRPSRGLKRNEMKHYYHMIKLKGEYFYISATLEKKENMPELVILICYNKNEQSFLQHKEKMAGFEGGLLTLAALQSLLLMKTERNLGRL